MKQLLMGVLCAAFFAGVARADIVFELKNDPQPGEENILFQMNQSGQDLTGYTQKSNVQTLFHSDVNMLQTQGIGQAQIVNQNGGNLNDILFSAPGYTFTDFIVDLNKADGSLINLTVNASDGTFTDQFTGGNGQNFVTILAKNGETINSIDFQSDGGWQTFKQPRVSGLAPVPEPGSLVMMGTGVLGVAGLLRRKLQLG